ncbi:hypothetical protein DPMN_167558 [Dreissena polymorpha]|uniref:Lipoxygenase domain-containing protein n=1 Tax=Dreissena polymorpha TaxID=45954 RepID=A0A9D4IWG5_DREPO|nr:hypothetical protein DPMN_167558 [Dreissena polymorpha]
MDAQRSTFFPVNMKERGVDSPEVVSDYLFRDDALLTYNAVLQYVTEYVILYYPSDTVLSQDFEIRTGGQNSKDRKWWPRGPGC